MTLLFLMTTSLVLAQGEKDTPKDRRSAVDAANDAIRANAGEAAQNDNNDGSKPKADPLLPPEPYPFATAETKEKYERALRGLYEYRERGYSFRSKVFDWNLISSKIIFCVVLSLVGFGIYFAFVQFRLAMRSFEARLMRKEGADPAQAMPQSKLGVSKEGVTVESSVLGVVILALSLGFFFLYLQYVYPVRDVF